MKIGLQLPQFRPSTPETMQGWFKDVAQAADQAGFDSLWVMDHFFQLGGNLGAPEGPMIEGYTTLGYFAGLTERVMLGLMVGGVIYRHPAVVIKSVTTLDVLSGGRAIFGIGAGWYQFESESLGLPFPSMKERFERLEDILQMAQHMWSGNTEPFEGKHVRALYPVSNPQPLQQPHPPILVGGMGPKKTLRFVAQYADACNLFGGAEIAVLRERLETLKKHCEDVGRDYAEIEKTTLLTVDMDELDQSLARAREMRGLGFEHLIVNMTKDYTPAAIDKLTGEFAEAVQEM